MSKRNLKQLIEKLNSSCKEALETAAGLCITQTHYNIEMEHVLLKILDQENKDIHHILSYFDIQEKQFKSALISALDSFETDNERHPKFSPHFLKMLRDSWFLASIDFQENAIRSGHLLISFLTSEQPYFFKDNQLNPINIETLYNSFFSITAPSEESLKSIKEISDLQKDNKKSALERYTINMTELARNGKIDPVIGRDAEINDMIDILQRRRQNNPILTGEAGVGKTTVVEGFVLKIIESSDIPPKLQNIAIHRLDMGLLQAGTGIRGEFEKRLTDLIKEVKASQTPIILFIDEVHTLIGAGSTSGPSGNATDLLKPELSRGDVCIIGATTWAEYEKYFYKDEALTRRFHVITVDEPDEPTALQMMKAIVSYYEQHHNVYVTNEALLAAVRLSSRYIPGRKLPDKAVSVLDTACAKVAISLSSKSSQLEKISREIENVRRELRLLNREIAFGRMTQEKRLLLEKNKEQLKSDYQKLEQKWLNEKEISQKIVQTRNDIETDLLNTSTDISQKQAQLKTYEDQLQKIQKDIPQIKTEVTVQTISEVISRWTGIPTGRLHTDIIDSVLNLKQNLSYYIIGQDSALDSISKTIQTAYAGIEDPSKPKGVLLLIGSSGIGKTETAISLARLLYGGEEKLISINMSEYNESHTISGLKGAPPGYVGYEDGGIITDAVNRKPFSVLLLDEMEKANTKVMDLFLQVFDKGVLEDGQGRRVDFKNTLILLTSNIGGEKIRTLCSDEETRPEPDTLVKMLYDELLLKFKPEFLGRLKIVPYYPLTESDMKKIIQLKLDQIVNRLKENKKIDLYYSDEVISYINRKCTQLQSGARNIDLILTNSLQPEISKEILSAMAKGDTIYSIHVSLNQENETFVFDIKK